ncbi:hypothetical protein [Candidatus Nanohalobium constans]|uniref:Uncharacterized protein n=1 Tax=Candidatus Nanohalobium constans TaxID=2565781 RepID=A0A5Q0UI77_9ARCH|nr:hypothetical protein [Candidatus Nanohalobium constans]QGA80579.1 hypothetical protein LC1Nh_0690 [Candidatus Nanohalobium constans]
MGLLPFTYDETISEYGPDSMPSELDPNGFYVEAPGGFNESDFQKMVEDYAESDERLNSRGTLVETARSIVEGEDPLFWIATAPIGAPTVTAMDKIFSAYRETTFPERINSHERVFEETKYDLPQVNAEFWYVENEDKRGFYITPERNEDELDETVREFVRDVVTSFSA